MKNELKENGENFYFGIFELQLKFIFLSVLNIFYFDCDSINTNGLKVIFELMSSEKSVWTTKLFSKFRKQWIKKRILDILKVNKQFLDSFNKHTKNQRIIKFLIEKEICDRLPGNWIIVLSFGVHFTEVIKNSSTTIVHQRFIFVRISKGKRIIVAFIGNYYEFLKICLFLSEKITRNDLESLRTNRFPNQVEQCIQLRIS